MATPSGFFNGQFLPDVQRAGRWPIETMKTRRKLSRLSRGSRLFVLRETEDGFFNLFSETSPSVIARGEAACFQGGYQREDLETLIALFHEALTPSSSEP